MFESGRAPAAIVASAASARSRTTARSTAARRGVIEANPKAVADYRAGKAEAVKFLVGQVMRETRGRADANGAAAVLRRRLDA